MEAVGEALHVAGEEEGGGGEAVGGVDGLKSQSPQLNSWTLNWMPTRRYELGTHEYGLHHLASQAHFRKRRKGPGELRI